MGHSGVGVTALLNLSLCIVFVAAAVTTTILANRTTRRFAFVEAKAKARILPDRNMATHTYFSQIMKPRLLEWTASFRSADCFEPGWMSSTYALRRIDDCFQFFNSTGYCSMDTAINARIPNSEADEYERTFFEELNSDPTLESRGCPPGSGARI